MDDEAKFREEIFRARDEGGARPRMKVVGGKDADKREPFKLHAARLPDPETIPPRRWLYGTRLIRGFVSVLVAPGGTGKSAWAIAAGLDMVTGKGFLGEHLYEPLRVAIINLDDPMDELERRVAALQIRYQIGRADLEGRLFLDDGEGRGLTVAEPGPDGLDVAYPDVEALIEQIRENGIDVVICDPFAESHSLEENSNPAMVKAAAAWRRVARTTGCAVLLVHHVRKGDVAGIDAARGAKALTDSARVGLLMTTMAEADADGFGISEDERWQYVRLDDAKRNMAPAREAVWFRLEAIPLGNEGLHRLYPRGDSVQAVVRWRPQTVWQRTPVPEIHRLLDLIEAGPNDGVRYSATKQGGSDRWCGQVLIDELGISEKQARAMIETWIKNGLLITRKYEDARQRKERAGVFVVASKRPTL